MSGSFIEVIIHSGNNIEYNFFGGYESRNQDTISLFENAFKLLDLNNISSKKFYISTDDISSQFSNKVTFGYTKSKNVVACPDFTFSKWTECGIHDYTNTIEKITSLSDTLPESDKIFWIGNPRTQDLRFKLIEIGYRHPEKMSFIAMDWIRKFPRGHMHRFTHFVSLEDHTKYKFLIDCGAAGFSGRLKFLLHTNRPLFLVDREDNKKDFFYDKLIPFEHYIPICGDLSDLLEMHTWAEKNYEKAIIIANNAKKFASDNLTKEKAIHYLAESINKYVKLS